jgi:hypothetical protein
MDKGSKKKSIFEEAHGATDARFEPINLNPKILAKFVTHEGPDFRRYTKRHVLKDPEDSSISRKKPLYEKHPMPDYNPDKEKYLKSLRLGYATFET